MESPAIICLFSHKCSDGAHELGAAIRDVLRTYSIDLRIDPFRVGDDVQTRMRTFDFDAFVFLSSPDSLASPNVQLELETAKYRAVPLFLVRMEGQVPAELRQRQYWTPPAIGDPAFAASIGDLGAAIRARVSCQRDIQLLHSDAVLYEMQEAAQRIALHADRSVVAEHAATLAQRYPRLSDPTTRYWIAIALGRVGTPQAVELLNGLPKHDHPYALEGVRQALEMAGRELSETS
jgi:hypothetical protein